MRSPAGGRRLLIAVVVLAMLTSMAVGVSPAAADVSQVSGGAVGYHTFIGFFGGAPEERGPVGTPNCPGTTSACSPSVTLPPAGSATPLTATAPIGATAQYGPATIHKSVSESVSTQGTTGPSGSVTSSATVAFPAQSQQNGPFLGDNAQSQCTAAEGGQSGSTTLTNASLVLATYAQDDPASGHVSGEPKIKISLPANPAPNTEYEGTIDQVGDAFRIIFNEQVRTPDAITVNAFHMYMLGENAVGDYIVAQSRCGVSATSTNRAPVANADAWRTSVNRPLTVAAPGVLANDTDADGNPLTARKPPGQPVPTSTPINCVGRGPCAAPTFFPGDVRHGRLTLNGDGSFTYTPNGCFVGTDTFTYVVSDPRGGSATGSVTITVTGAAPPRPLADFDADAKTDVSVYRPSTGVWYLRRSTAGDTSTSFGTSGDIPVPADYCGDGKADVAVYRPSTGVWYLRPSTAGDTSTIFGASGDIPVPADYDGDGKADIAVYRPSTGVWYLRRSTAGDASTIFGTSGDIPVPADYDGDGKADVAVYRPSTGVWYLRRSTAGNTSTIFGASGDIPVVADYDGDGKADVAVYRPSTGVWYLRRSTAGDASTIFGASGDIPVVADYDGDGKADVAVYRRSTGVWYLRRSTAGDTSTIFGASGDIPVPLPAAIRLAFFP